MPDRTIQMQAAPADLAADTDPVAVRGVPGWYRIDLPAHWDFVKPSGGVLMTAALRAMALEVADPELTPRSATATFAAPVGPGPLHCRVTKLRHGSGAAQLRAELSLASSAGPGLEVTATFARAREGPTFTTVKAPKVSGPLECGQREAKLPPAPYVPPYWRNFDSHLALGHHWWVEGWKAGPAEYARWFKYKVPQLVGSRQDTRLDPLAIPPVADMMPPAVREFLGPDHPRLYAPSLDLTVQWLQPTTSEWLLLWACCAHASDGYASGDVHLFDEERCLVARATQQMVLRRTVPR